jgi:Ca2+-binding EF-hand superfamily protein
MSTISGASSSSNVWAALNTQRSQHQAKMFAKVDTDGSGSVSETELSTMLDDVSKKTGTSLGDSKELFSKMDSNADGQLSSAELDAGMKALMPPPSTMEFAQSHTLGGSNNSQDDRFAKVDTDGDGAVSKDEFQALSDKIKADTGKDANQDFSKLDTDGDGQLNKAEFDAGRPQPPEGQQAAQGAGGPPPAGGPGGPPPAGGAGGAKSASSSDTTYDTLDTNQDGVVSEVERMVGELRDALAGLGNSDSNTSTDSTTAANQKIVELAQKIYAQVAQNLSGSSESSLSAMA